MKRTQISLKEDQHEWLKLVAMLCSWRIQNHPLHKLQPNTPSPSDTSAVSMAEVVRFLIDDRVAHVTAAICDGELPLQGPDADPGRNDAPARMQEIGYAVVDASIYLNEERDLGVPDDPGKVPDSRRIYKDHQ